MSGLNLSATVMLQNFNFLNIYSALYYIPPFNFTDGIDSPSYF